MIPPPKGVYWGTRQPDNFTSRGRLGGSTTADASAVSAAGTGCGQPPILMVLDELVAYFPYAISRSWGIAEMSGKVVRLRRAKKYRNATSHSKGRRGNDAYRVREHLTEAEMEKLLAALKGNRHGHRHWLIGLVIYRHGLRVSEACDLRWDDIDLRKRTIIVRRLKGSTDSVHYLERDEVNDLKLLQRQQQAKSGAYVFIDERGQPFGRMGIGRMIERAGEAARLPFPVHVQHAAAFDGIRTGGPGNGHTAAPALPGACLDHEHRALHRNVAGALQGHLALISAHRRRSAAV
jgi:integrase